MGLLDQIHFFTLCVFGIGSLLILPLRIVTQRPLYNPSIYRVLIVFSLIFWLHHYLWIVNTTAGWGREASPLSGMWFFSLIGPLLVVSILALAVWGVTHCPLLVAFTPAALFLLTWFVTLRVLYWRAPSYFTMADNIPQVWLFIGSAAATIFLFLFALGSRQACIKT